MSGWKPGCGSRVAGVRQRGEGSEVLLPLLRAENLNWEWETAGARCKVCLGAASCAGSFIVTFTKEACFRTDMNTPASAHLN